MQFARQERMLRNSRERAGKDAMEGIGEKGSIVDFLVTRIAHFRFAYMTPFVRKLGTKRSSSPTVPFARVQGAGLVGEREAKKREDGKKEDDAGDAGRVYEVTRRNKYNIMQTGEADRARQSLGNLGNPE